MDEAAFRDSVFYQLWDLTQNLPYQAFAHRYPNSQMRHAALEDWARRVSKQRTQDEIPVDTLTTVKDSHATFIAALRTLERKIEKLTKQFAPLRTEIRQCLAAL